VLLGVRIVLAVVTEIYTVILTRSPRAAARRPEPRALSGPISIAEWRGLA
jgi:hypothetical protein